MWQRAAKHLGTILVTMLLAGFASVVLVSIAPGFGTDERTLDPRYRAETVRALQEEAGRDRNVWTFYWSFLRNAAHGDFGVSRSLDRPVKQLLGERIPVTAASILYGLIGGWAAGFAFAALATYTRSRNLEIASVTLSTLFLCTPAAVVALAFLLLRFPARLAIAGIVFPKVFSYTRSLLENSQAMPHVLAARARGLGAERIFLWHVVPTAAPELAALAGVSVGLAFAAAIPVEVVCDLPGVGQLAWQAALGRDLPLLTNITLLVTLVTMTANRSADLAISALTEAQ
jgi:peptide/nickel transport system permease protein